MTKLLPQITIDHPEVSRWIGKCGVECTKMNPKYGDLFVITNSPNGKLRFLRCFRIGDTVAVSVDFEGDATSMISHLVEQYVD